MAMDKLVVSNCSSTLVEDEVSDLLLSANISSSEYEFLVPQEHHRANNPPEGYIPVYKDQIELGLRFPLHQLVLEICNRMKVSPSQLTPDAHSAIVGFILCAKLYNVPMDVKWFFSLFTVSRYNSECLFRFIERPSYGFLRMGGVRYPYGEWMSPFFFLRPVGKSWNCITNWRENHRLSPPVPSVRNPLLKLVRELGMLEPGFRVAGLVEKELLVQGGIEQPGHQPPQFTFKYLMHQAAITKFVLQPEDIPPANSTKILDSSFVSKECYENLEKEKQQITSNLRSTKSKVQELEQEIELYKAKRADFDSRTSQATVKVKMLEKRLEKVKSESDGLRDKIKKDAVEEFKSSNAFANAVQKEAVKYYANLDKEKQEVILNLKSAKSRVQELEEKIELYKAQIFNSCNRASEAMLKVKMLENRLEIVKSNSDCLHDKIKNDAIEEFKSSDDFANAVQEEAVKYYMNGFDACKLRVLNSGKLPSGFNFDFLDVADAEWGSSPGPVDNAVTDQDKKSFKRKRT